MHFSRHFFRELWFWIELLNWGRFRCGDKLLLALGELTLFVKHPADKQENNNSE